MSIIEMKLPHPTALLHPSRIHPLASGIEVVVLSVGSMTSLQATAVSQWVLNILGWSSNNDIP
jgi:NADH:ubiquinone oxidoreductase subunit H